MRRLFALLTTKRLTVWSLALLVLGWGLHVFTMATPGLVDRDGRFKGGDYTYFYLTGSLVAEGRSDALYDLEAHVDQGRRRIDPDLQLFAAHANYPPQTAFALAPLSRLPFGPSLAVFLVLSAIAYGVSVWIVWRCCPALASRAGVVALLAAALPALLTVIRYGQLSAFTLLFWALATAAFARGRSFAAGLAIGSLVYKPQLGLVIGVALIAARDWRAVAGALVAAAAQLAVGWVLGGTEVMRAYFDVLWTLALNPSLVQPYPSEVHSVRGLLQLLRLPPDAVTIGSIVALFACLWAGIRVWTSRAPAAWRMGAVVVLTILASPHLLAYDLLLLTIPLLVFADFAIANPHRPERVAIALLLVPLYLAPFSGNLARLLHLQLSVIAMAVLAWRVATIPGLMSTPRGTDRG